MRAMDNDRQIRTRDYTTMKRKNIIMAAVLGMAICAMPVQAFDKYSINREDLPETAQQFLTDHFDKARVSMVKTDKHLLKKTDYDVKLVNGTKIDFNNKGEWTCVDCKQKEVPASLIPSKVAKYVAANFPETFVTKIEKKTLSYEIELNDGVGLKFDRLGNFKSMKLDD